MNTLIINPEANILDIQDEIDKKISQARATIITLWAEDEQSFNLSYETIANVLWLLEDLLGEIEMLTNASWNKYCSKNKSS